MKAKTIMTMFMLALCGSMHAQGQQMNIEMMDGNTVSYQMAQVQEVVYDNGMTVITLRGQETFKMVIYKNDDIKAITWSDSDAEARKTETQKNDKQ